MDKDFALATLEDVAGNLERDARDLRQALVALAAALARAERAEAALRGLLPVADLAYYYLPGELAEDPVRVQAAIAEAQDALAANAWTAASARAERAEAALRTAEKALNNCIFVGHHARRKDHEGALEEIRAALAAATLANPADEEAR